MLVGFRFAVSNLDTDYFCEKSIFFVIAYVHKISSRMRTLTVKKFQRVRVRVHITGLHVMMCVCVCVCVCV